MALPSSLLKFPVVVLQRTAKKCTKIQNSRAQPLFCSSNLLLGVAPVDVAVVVCQNYTGTLYRARASARSSA